MKLLVLGGTRFVGRHLVTAALARKHEVTLFNRGRHSSANQTDVETIQGDRNSDLVKLQGRRWDAVIDTCGYLPRTVRASAEVLTASVERYVFISSQSVYSDLSVIGVDETAPLATLTSEQVDEANSIDSSGQSSALTYGKMYGGLKVLCEQAVEEVMPGRVLIVRPGLIVGPNDYTGRFSYWVERVASGGEVLAPGRPNRFVQFIDVRDLAEWVIRMIEHQETGIYNSNGLANELTMEDVLHQCKVVSGSDASFTWVSEDFLLQEGVAAWTEMPLWLPEEAAPQLKGFMFIKSDKAVASGLTFRSVSATIRDILGRFERRTTQHSSLDTKNRTETGSAGISSHQEQMLLLKWHESADSRYPMRDMTDDKTSSH